MYKLKKPTEYICDSCKHEWKEKNVVPLKRIKPRCPECDSSFTMTKGSMQIYIDKFKEQKRKEIEEQRKIACENGGLTL